MDAAASGATSRVMTGAPDPAAAAEVFYDGACPLCRREIATYRGLRGLERVVWRDVADEDVTVPDLDREAALARFHVRRADGRIVDGADAFLSVWRRSFRLRPIAVALDRAPFRSALELGYRVFLRVRPIWR